MIREAEAEIAAGNGVDANRAFAMLERILADEIATGVVYDSDAILAELKRMDAEERATGVVHNVDKNFAQLYAKLKAQGHIYKNKTWVNRMT